MELLLIREFLTVADILSNSNGDGSFAQAAEALNIYPSTLSKHIKQLEDELGAPLFDRTTRRVSLNDFGHFFHPHAIKIYDSYSECQTAVEQYLLPKRPKLHFGCAVPVASGKYFRALRVCRKAHPGCQFQIAEFSDWHLKEMLRNGQLEFIIAYSEKVPGQEFTAYPIEEDSLVVMVSQSHPLASKEIITVEDLKDENIVTNPTNSFVGVLVRDLFRSAGYTPHIWYSDNSSGNLANVIDHGGIGLLMSSSAYFLAGKHTKVIPLSSSRTLSLHVLCLPNHKLSPVASTFLSSLLQSDSSVPIEIGGSHDH